MAVWALATGASMSAVGCSSSTGAAGAGTGSATGGGSGAPSHPGSGSVATSATSSGLSGGSGAPSGSAASSSGSVTSGTGAASGGMSTESGQASGASESSGSVASAGTNQGGSGFSIPPNVIPPITVDPANVISFAPISTAKPSLTPGANTATVPTALWAGHAAPLPTNTFWMNLVTDSGEDLAAPFPYHVNAVAAGLQINKPESLTVTSSNAYESANAQVAFGAVESLTSHAATSWDLVSATFTWNASSGTMSVPLVYGAPYVTAMYAGLTPKISVPGGIKTVNGSASGTATSARFDMQIGTGQEWIVYTSAPVAATWSANALTFASPFKGWARVARANTAMPAAILDQYAGVVPTGGELRLSVENGTGVVELSWQTQGTGDLLVMALPHHMGHLAKPQTVAASFSTIRGQMTGVVGNLWQLQYALSPALRSAPTPVDPTRMSAILTALTSDASYRPDGNTDSYDFGKNVGKAAELLLIAEALGQTSIANQLRTAIENVLGPWIAGNGSDALLYDTTWGGVVTAHGINNGGAVGTNNDYGNGVYNDHHFHYGYLLYAAGAVAKGDPAWAMQNADFVHNLVRDIANPSPNDPYFPQFRMMDWYDGHSWASGVATFGDGRNQESSSEAFNAWAGLSLWGDAVGDMTLYNLGRVMRAVEAASVQRYYHIRANSDIYPQPFAAKMSVGILWSDKGDFSTWFSSAPSNIYGIQLLPITIAAEELVDKAWMTDAWPTLMGAAGGDGWGGQLYMGHAVIDAQDAWNELMTAGIDQGNSRTNMLYWAATRP
jgi:endo-1,3(4)-beta-glucanase